MINHGSTLRDVTQAFKNWQAITGHRVSLNKHTFVENFIILSVGDLVIYIYVDRLTAQQRDKSTSTLIERVECPLMVNVNVNGRPMVMSENDVRLTDRIDHGLASMVTTFDLAFRGL